MAKDFNAARRQERGQNNVMPDAHIPPGASFTGDIDTKSGLRIDGNVKGNLAATGNIDISTEGSVEGAVKGQEIHIAGSVTGNVSSEAAVQLLGGAKLIGDLCAQSLTVEEGAIFKGKCAIGCQMDEPKAVNAKAHAEKKKARSQSAPRPTVVTLPEPQPKQEEKSAVN